MGERMRYSEDPPHTEGDGLRAVADALDRLRDEMGLRHTENSSSLEVIEKELMVLTERMDDLSKGFPGGDWEGHRRYHEAVIKRMEARTDLYRELQSELAKKGLWALIVMACTAVWFYFKSHINNGG
jgi:hypothetical protein